jgi:predicted transposase YdaD
MSNQSGNIHDNFFKKALSDPQQAGTFLREHLPPDVAGLLDYEEPLVPLPASYVDEKLQGHHSDLLFGVHLKAGGNALAYVLDARIFGSASISCWRKRLCWRRRTLS